MFIPIILLAAIIFTTIIHEIIVIFVYGKPLDKNIIDEFLYKYLDGFEINPYNDEIINNCNHKKKPPFISTAKSLLFKYHVDDFGVIFRWSDATRKLDHKFKTLQSPKLTLKSFL